MDREEVEDVRLAAAIAIHGGGPGSGDFGHGGTGRNPAAIIFNNRMKKAGKIAKILIRHNFGSSMVRRFQEEHWQQVGKAAGIKIPHDPKTGSLIGPETRKMVIGMLDKRWKVKAK